MGESQSQPSQADAGSTVAALHPFRPVWFPGVSEARACRGEERLSVPERLRARVSTDCGYLEENEAPTVAGPGLPPPGGMRASRSPAGFREQASPHRSPPRRPGRTPRGCGLQERPGASLLNPVAFPLLLRLAHLVERRSSPSHPRGCSAGSPCGSPRRPLEPPPHTSRRPDREQRPRSAQGVERQVPARTQAGRHRAPALPQEHGAAPRHRRARNGGSGRPRKDKTALCGGKPSATASRGGTCRATSNGGRTRARRAGPGPLSGGRGHLSPSPRPHRADTDPPATTVSSQGPSSSPTSSPWFSRESHSSTSSWPSASTCGQAASGCGRPCRPTWAEWVGCPHPCPPARSGWEGGRPRVPREPRVSSSRQATLGGFAPAPKMP